jgi:hypothetical protein
LPENGGVQYDLGVCEQALGHVDRAEAAWARVPPGLPHARRAALMRARQALKIHRFSPAERLLPAALEEQRFLEGDWLDRSLCKRLES